MMRVMMVPSMAMVRAAFYLIDFDVQCRFDGERSTENMLDDVFTRFRLSTARQSYGDTRR